MKDWCSVRLRITALVMRDLVDAAANDKQIALVVGARQSRGWNIDYPRNRLSHAGATRHEPELAKLHELLDAAQHLFVRRCVIHDDAFEVERDLLIDANDPNGHFRLKRKELAHIGAGNGIEGIVAKETACYRRSIHAVNAVVCDSTHLRKRWQKVNAGKPACFKRRGKLSANISTKHRVRLLQDEGDVRRNRARHKLAYDARRVSGTKMARCGIDR